MSHGSGVSFSGTNFQQLATVPERCETAQLLEALDSQVPRQHGDIMWDIYILYIILYYIILYYTILYYIIILYYI